MKTKVNIYLGLLLLGSSTIAQAQSSQLLSWIADSLNEAGDHYQSVIYYDSAIRLNTSDYTIYYGASCVHALEGNIGMSIEYLNRSFDLGNPNFDWMYYDTDLNVIRQTDEYKELEAKFKDKNTIYFFDIIRDLMKYDQVIYQEKRISLGTDPNYYEDYLGNYDIIDVYNRLGMDSTASRFDFSDKVLDFWLCDFTNESESTLIRFLKLKKLVFVGGKGFGELILADMEVEDLLIIATEFTDITIDNIIQDGLFQILNRGEYLNIKNSNFSLQSKSEYYDNASKLLNETAISKINFQGESDRVLLNNVNFTESSDTDFQGSFPINIQTKSFEIKQSNFTIPLEFRGSATKMDFHDNNFNSYVDFTEFQFPEFNSYIPYNQFHQAFVDIAGVNQEFKIMGITPADLKELQTYDRIVYVLKRLHNNYRDRGEISSANQVYRDLKNLEILHLLQLENKNESERIRLVLNQIMGFYTDHGTSPGKAIQVSLYIIFIFSIFYFLFPSEWDKESKSKLVHDLKIFVKKNDHGYFHPFLKLSKGFAISFLNAFTLSINAFITLGFGKIPTIGVAKYICILQGLIGWFLLSLFTVSLINQVLL